MRATAFWRTSRCDPPQDTLNERFGLFSPVEKFESVPGLEGRCSMRPWIAGSRNSKLPLRHCSHLVGGSSRLVVNFGAMNKLAMLATCLVPLISFAQTTVKEPEFADTFAALSTSGDLVSLEHETATIRAGGGGFMVANGKAAYEIPGEKSPVRFHGAPELVFVVRSSLAQTDIDPATLYVLRRLDTKKKNREVAFFTGHFTPFGGHATTNLNAGQIPLTFARYGASSYRITASNLAPGEYALSRVYGQDVYCFGVD